MTQREKDDAKRKETRQGQEVEPDCHLRWSQLLCSLVPVSLGDEEGILCANTP
jgi:hypothetical protein